MPDRVLTLVFTDLVDSTALKSEHGDYVFLYDSHQIPLFESLGTPETDKKLILYDAGHAPLPEVETIRDTLAWLDKYQPLSVPSD